MQTQNESQSCETKNGSLSSSPRPFKGPDSTHSPQRSSGSPGLRSCLAGASPTASPVRPLLASAVGGYGAGAVASRHASLVTCAESLSPLLSNHNDGSVRPSSSDMSAGILNQGNCLLDTDEIDCSRFKFTVREDDLSPSSSRCGSPVRVSDSRHVGLGLYDSAYHESQSTTATNVEARKGTRQLDSYCSGPGVSLCKDGARGDDDLVSQVGTADLLSPLPYDEFNEFGTNAGSFDYLKRPVRVASADSPGKVTFNGWLPSLPSGTRLETVDAMKVSTIGSGAGSEDFEYLRNPVRGARTVLLERRGKATVNGWMSSGPTLKGGVGKGIRSIHDSTSYDATSPEDSNVVRHTALRACVLCGTTKTPLWRSGPHGPKSLCNACGIRFKKAKRCSGQSEGSDFTGSPIASPEVAKSAPRPLKRKQETGLFCQATSPRESGTEVAVTGLPSSQNQKRSRWPQLLATREAESHGIEVTGSSGESCLTWNFHYPSSGSPISGKSSDLCVQAQNDFVNRGSIDEHQHVTGSGKVAKDEEEAAVLLMYLSCGLVYA